MGVAVAHLERELARRSDVRTIPYLVSYRARADPTRRRLPLPAAVATRAWSRLDVPRLDRWLRGADVIHGTNITVPPTRLPTVISVYDCWFLAHPDQVTPDVARAARILRRAVRRGAHVHVSSAATARVAADLLETDRIHVVHLGPPEPPGPAEPDGDLRAHLDGSTAGSDPVPSSPFVLFVGTIERRKDAPALVEAFGRLAGHDAGTHLVLAGAPGNDQDRVDGAVARLPGPVRDRVHVLGAVDATTKRRLLRSARALAYPSLDEGFGFPILEAQQVGVPVVARRVGSIPEVGGTGVELVDPVDIDDLADALGRVLTDAALRARLVAAGTTNLERFSWADTADRLVALYRLAIREHQGYSSR